MRDMEQWTSNIILKLFILDTTYLKFVPWENMPMLGTKGIYSNSNQITTEVWESGPKKL